MSEQKDWNDLIARLGKHLDDCEDGFCDICNDIHGGLNLLEGAIAELDKQNDIVLQERTCSKCGIVALEDIMFVCGQCGKDFCSPCKDKHRCKVKNFNREAFFKWRDDLRRKSLIALKGSEEMKRRVDENEKRLEKLDRELKKLLNK